MSKMRGYSVFLTALLFFGFIVSSSEAATYYVNNQLPNASDANPGTLDLPWMTIQHAADMVNAGDTVIVKPGVYNESVKISRGGTSSAPVIFKGESGAVVDGTGVFDENDLWSNGNGFINLVWNQQNGWWDVSPVNFIQIEGFEIRNFYTGVTVQSVRDSDNAIIGGNGWIVENNVIHDIQHSGVFLMGGGTPEGANIITGNFFYNNNFDDIHTHNYSIVEKNIAISRTELENIRDCASMPYSKKVNNNTVMNGTFGIQISHIGNEYKNNVIMNIQPRTYVDWDGQLYQRGGYAFNARSNVVPDLSMVNVSYNNIYDSYAAVGVDYGYVLYSDISGLPNAIGNISADPLFVNNTGDHTGDYHLTASSPCIDAGDPADPVPQGGGSRIDIGAYEFGKEDAVDIPSLIDKKHEFFNSGLIDNKGIMVSLDAKLNAAQAALVRGKAKTARNILNALINEAKAQSGKHINTGAAQSLIEDAEIILRSIAKERQ